MKKLILLLLISTFAFAQNPTRNPYGFFAGNSGMSPSAIVQFDSTTKGFLLPRMTTIQRDAIASPAPSLLIFNTTTGEYNYYDGSEWMSFEQDLQRVLTKGGTATDLAIFMSNTINDNTLAIESNALSFENTTTGDSSGVSPTVVRVQNEDGQLIEILKDKIRRTKVGFSTDLVFTDPTEDRQIFFPDSDGDVALISQSITNGVTTHSPSEDAVYDAIAAIPIADLQAATDEGATTTNAITINGTNGTNYIDGGYTTLTDSFSGNGLNLTPNISSYTRDGFYYNIIPPFDLVATRNVYFPDKSGTVAFLDDITGASTNLSYTASSTNGTVTSDTGTDATLPLADGTNAGLLKPADYTQLSTLASDLSGKQATLVSGTNIKTVNSTSLLGSGNLAVGDALVANPLSQFASTTSAQLAGVISNETGTDKVVFSDSPTLTGTPNAPTQSANDNTTKIATTAYADAKVQNSLSSSTTIAPSATAVNTALDARSRFLIQRSVGSHTGNTTETIISSLEIPANTFITGSTFDWIALMNKTATTTPTYKLYINTSNSLSGATQIGLYIPASANQTMPMSRWFYLTSTDLVGSTSVANMLTTLSVAASQTPLTFTYDKTQAYWFIVTTTNSDGSMTSTCVNQSISIK